MVTMTGANGSTVTLSSLGAGIVEVIVPDRLGNLADVVLGYRNAADYMADGPCAGKIPGRYANRIARGRFSIDGTEYQLAINNGPNALHGGPTGFQNHIWDVDLNEIDKGVVVFTLQSPDGDEGYPGNLNVKARYTWADDENCLSLELTAETDKPTVVNLTNHAYWNLDGEGSSDILSHKLKLNASRYVPTDETLIPTGEIAEAKDTPMDFMELRTIGDRINDDYPALKYGKGYDNCWLVDEYRPEQVKEVAVLQSEQSGRCLTVRSSQPAVQVYTGNWLDGSPVAKSGKPYRDYDGVAIECQAVPDSPNQPVFPSTRLNPGREYRQVIEFIFTTIE